MDLMLLFNIAMSVIAFLGGWLIKGIFDRLKDLERSDLLFAAQVADIRVALPTHYVRREDFKEFSDSLFTMLRRIEDKIDEKADKP